MKENRIPKIVATTISLLLVPSAIFGAATAIPYVFTAGTPIRADEVNANFTALADGLASHHHYGEGWPGSFGSESASGPADIKVPLLAGEAHKPPPTSTVCLVTAHVSMMAGPPMRADGIMQFPTGTVYLRVVAEKAGKIADTPNWSQIANVDVLARNYSASQTHLFTLSPQETFRFGCQLEPTFDFAGVSAYCDVTYLCR